MLGLQGSWSPRSQSPARRHLTQLCKHSQVVAAPETEQCQLVLAVQQACRGQCGRVLADMSCDVGRGTVGALAGQAPGPRTVLCPVNLCVHMMRLPASPLPHAVCRLWKVCSEPLTIREGQWVPECAAPGAPRGALWGGRWWSQSVVAWMTEPRGKASPPSRHFPYEQEGFLGGLSIQVPHGYSRLMARCDLAWERNSCSHTCLVFTMHLPSGAALCQCCFVSSARQPWAVGSFSSLFYHKNAPEAKYQGGTPQPVAGGAVVCTPTERGARVRPAVLPRVPGGGGRCRLGG